MDMQTILTTCPACGQDLQISALHCAACGLELRNSFSISPFEKLSEEQSTFLLTFLRCRGNLSTVQTELSLSYPAAKKQLDDLLITLGLMDAEANLPALHVDRTIEYEDCTSIRPSEIIKTKLLQNGGRAVVYTARKLPCEIRILEDGSSMWCDKLPIHPPYQFSVFDTVVELLLIRGGSARKGNGRNCKLGDPDCDETTVVGYIGKHYSQKAHGDSVYDPVFVLAAVLEWAGIAQNGRGTLTLTPEYLANL